MCRIVGGIEFSGTRNLTEEIIISMRDELSDGGPDGFGLHKEDNVFLAHRRLSIIDLSNLGHQPMVFENFVITFNGEIYNYKEIKSKLENLGIIFRSNSDTEVIVRAYEIWGKSALNLFRGMFAFALWDKLNKKLILCRDRFGVKPLYLYKKDDIILFSSEIKAFHKYPNFDKTLDLSGLPNYLAKGFFRETDCIFKFVKKVQPGQLIEIDSNGDTSEIKYWDINDIKSPPISDKLDINESVENLEQILTKSFSLRMVSDVPVGVFLSGGIDSSLVTAILQKDRISPINTFNVSFEDKSYNEGLIAKEIAGILGTSHSSIECTEKDFLDVIPKLSYIYDEPFGDSSAIPTYLISKYAQKSVKVALSGDGADELFGGYTKYKFISRFERLLGIPQNIRSILMKGSYLISPSVVESIYSILGKNKYSQVQSKFLKMRQCIGANDISELYDLSSSFLSKNEIDNLFNFDVNNNGNYSSRDGLISTFGAWDLMTFLPSDVLTKVDRASMSASLESREPFLDPEVLEFAFALPDEFKINKAGETKFILRKLLSKYLPSDVINRPKFGFTIPINDWMIRNLKEEILEMINDTKFFETFKLNQSLISQKCNFLFINRGSVNPHSIWFIFCLYKWYEKWL